MLPEKIRYALFDHLSVKTMRYVSAVPTRQAEGLTKQVYDMIREDFFKNGSLTSRSKVPELMAAIWTAGREAMLVEDSVDRTTKDAICAVRHEEFSNLGCPSDYGGIGFQSDLFGTGRGWERGMRYD